MTGLFDGFEGYQVLAGADVDRALTSALVAVDANVLLNLYRYNLQTTNDLLAVFERLGDQPRQPDRGDATLIRRQPFPSRGLPAALKSMQRTTW
ncbi:PIN-like domain-containing protein [Micromonospora sp. DT233]|uniref:PIN-like domain-containing protein n=1 Tax=Micromonospora sp. DT233 TaxID=3393432 RepID=UPI003CE9F6C9